MDNHAAETIARRFVKNIRGFLEEATSFARAADLCADSGNIDGAVKIVMDFEDPAASAQEMLKAL